MSDVSQLTPLTLPKVQVSNADRITVALDTAMKDHQTDISLGDPARGIAVVFFREYKNGTFGESWIIEGMNALEVVGLMHLVAADVLEYGMDGPAHFPDGRPEPEPA